MKAETGKTYAQILHGRCHWIFTGADLPEWNENHIQVVDVTEKIPKAGDVWDGVAFSTYVTPAKLPEQINAEVDVEIFNHFRSNLPAILEALETTASGASKAVVKAINDKVKAALAKKV